MMGKRILSALAMVPLLIGAILYPNPQLFQLLCWLFIGIGVHEFFTIAWPDAPKGHRYFATFLGLLMAAFWILEGPRYISGLAVSSALVISAFLFFALQGLVTAAHHRLAHIVLGIYYVCGLGVHIAFIRTLPDGIYWVFTLLAATWFNDTAAYFTGRKWGKHRLAATLSPGKTWEGWAGGFVGSALGVYLFWRLFARPIPFEQAALLVPLAAVFGPLGDLCESLLKRSIGVKDSGQIIPGHGGVLDRIDALLFTGPLFYYFALYIVY